MLSADVARDDRTVIYAALLRVAGKLRSDEREKALTLWTAKGKRALQDGVGGRPHWGRKETGGFGGRGR